MKVLIKTSIITSIIQYLVISFIAWDITWAALIPNWTNGERFVFIAIVMLKISLDVVITSIIDLKK